MKRTSGFSTLAALVLFGCGGTKDTRANSAHSINGHSFLIIADSTLLLTKEDVSGEGEIAFIDPIGSTSSNKNFQVEFRLDDGGRLDLKTFANNSLDSGVELLISRSGERIFLSATTKDNGPVSHELKALDANGLLALSIDVHNSETPAHALIWSNTEQSPTDDNAIFNSDADGAIAGNGAGVYWGMALSGAKVSKVDTGSAKFGH